MKIKHSVYIDVSTPKKLHLHFTTGVLKYVHDVTLFSYQYTH